MRAARRARIVGDADLRQGRCLEIGPLANPVVSPEVADVRYVVTDTPPRRAPVEPARAESVAVR